MNPLQNDSPLTVGKCRVAAVQMVSTPRVDENLATAGRLIAEAVAQGAQLVALPEYFPIMGLRERDKAAVREVDGDGPIQSFLAQTAPAAWHLAGRWVDAAGGECPGQSAQQQPRL